MTIDMREFSPECPPGRGRPASQDALAALLESCDAERLKDMLIQIAREHAFAWEADAMLRRVGGFLADGEHPRLHPSHYQTSI